MNICTECDGFAPGGGRCRACYEKATYTCERCGIVKGYRDTKFENLVPRCDDRGSCDESARAASEEP